MRTYVILMVMAQQLLTPVCILTYTVPQQLGHS